MLTYIYNVYKTTKMKFSLQIYKSIIQMVERNLKLLKVLYRNFHTEPIDDFLKWILNYSD